jgi:hypothetical protein
MACIAIMQRTHNSGDRIACMQLDSVDQGSTQPSLAQPTGALLSQLCASSACNLSNSAAQHPWNAASASGVMPSTCRYADAVGRLAYQQLASSYQQMVTRLWLETWLQQASVRKGRHADLVAAKARYKRTHATSAPTLQAHPRYKRTHLQTSFQHWQQQRDLASQQRHTDHPSAAEAPPGSGIVPMALSVVAAGSSSQSSEQAPSGQQDVACSLDSSVHHVHANSSSVEVEVAAEACSKQERLRKSYCQWKLQLQLRRSQVAAAKEICQLHSRKLKRAVLSLLQASAGCSRRQQAAASQHCAQHRLRLMLRAWHATAQRARCLCQLERSACASSQHCCVACVVQAALPLLAWHNRLSGQLLMASRRHNGQALRHVLCAWRAEASRCHQALAARYRLTSCA